MIEILVASIGGLSLVIVAALGAKMNGRIKDVQGHVVNHHGSSNMRVEFDQRHEENRRWFMALWNRHDITDSRLYAVEKLMREQAERVDNLEDTMGVK